MQLKIIIPLMLFTSSLPAKDLGTVGTTFKIKEQSLLEVIQSKLNALQQSGKMESHQQEVQQRVKKSVERPGAVAGITPARHYSRQLYDPSFVLDAAIKDHLGNLIGRQGAKYNPLDKLSFGQPLVFIDGDDDLQVQWALTQPGKTVLVKGAPIALSKQHDRTFYFDQGGVLVTKFSIAHVPAKVSQADKHLLIEMIPLTGEYQR